MKDNWYDAEPFVQKWKKDNVGLINFYNDMVQGSGFSYVNMKHILTVVDRYRKRDKKRP